MQIAQGGAAQEQAPQEEPTFARLCQEIWTRFKDWSVRNHY